MPRYKVALGMVLIAGAAIVIAMAIWARTPDASHRTAVELGRTAPSGAGGEKKPPVKASKPDAILKNFGKLPVEPEGGLSSGPRMQSKQIKMH